MGEIERICIDGCEIKGISDLSVEADDIEEFVKENTVIVPHYDSATITVTCKINRMTLYKIIGLWDWAIENCSNKRVVYLMKHGKNDKVKMKNFRRSLRIIEKVLAE